MRDSCSKIGTRGINEGGAPSTFEWNEWESRQERPSELEPRAARAKLRSAAGTAKEGRPASMPELTDEQLARSARAIYAALCRLVREVGVDGHRAWSLRTASAWCGAYSIAELATRELEEPAGDTPPASPDG